MKVKDFEIGKVYVGTMSSVWARFDKESVVSLDEASKDDHMVVQISSGGFNEDYEEMNFDSLSEIQQEIYYTYLPKTEQSFDTVGCTCSNDQLFNGGCKCGEFQKETA